MSPPDSAFMVSFVQEEMSDVLFQTVRHVLPLLPPVTRLRLLAFVHLLEDPGSMHAQLDVDPGGGLRLTLAAREGGPCH